MNKVKHKNCILYNADCLDILKNIPDESINLILTDPPYGMLNCKWDKVIDYDKLWNEYRRIISKNGVIVLFGAGKFTFNVVNTNPEMFRFKCVWIKRGSTNFPNAKARPMSKHEDILVFSHAKCTPNAKVKMIYNPQGLIEVNKTMKNKNSKASSLISSSKVADYVQVYSNYPNDVLIDFPATVSNKKHHTSEKPIRLLEYLIKTYSNIGDTVLDSCMGSGSTCIAAQNTGRISIGIEKDQLIFDKAVLRIIDET